MANILMSPYCTSSSQLIGAAPVPCGTEMVSKLLVIVIHLMAVALFDSFSQKVTIPSESMCQSAKGGLMPCSQILSFTDDLC